MKKIIILIVLLVVGGALWFVFFNSKEEGGVMCTMEAKLCPDGSYVGRSGPKCEFTECPGMIEKITYTKATADLIVPELPFPGAVTGKEFSVTGQARGTWYFEATFPIDVLDKDGNILVQSYAQAEGEWMTADFVPFRGEVKVPESYIGPATLILRKSNASGLPEHDASISFPITVEY